MKNNFFYRHKRYRCSSFAQADANVYSNSPFMKRYMEGLLLSQLYWHNHAKSYISHSRFIDRYKSQFSYLEIGPGHGLYLSSVAKQIKCSNAEAWDFSLESLKQTKNSLKKLGISKHVTLQNRDVQEFITDPPSSLFI